MKMKGYIRRLLGLFLAFSLLLCGNAVLYAEEPQESQTGAAVQEETEDPIRQEVEEEDKEEPDGEKDPIRQETGGTAETGGAAAASGTAAETETQMEEQETQPAEMEIQAAQEERQADPEDLGYVPGEILVVYKEDVAEQEVAETAAGLDGELEDTVIELEEESIAKISISDETTVETAVEEYMQDPAVTYAGPNYIMEIFEEENTVSAAGEWTAESGALYHLGYIKAPGAWDIAAGYQGNKVKVAVIDTGADVDHEDLSGVINRDLSKEILWDEQAKEYSTGPLRGDGYCNGNAAANPYSTHGTHVSGIIAAQSGNNVGVQGAGSGGSTSAANKIVDLVVIDAFPSQKDKGNVKEDTATTADVIYALGYAKEAGCKVVNLSLGTSESDENLRKTCEALKADGITIVCAAGNSNENTPVYPCDYDSAIGVISVDPTGQKSSSSNYGSAKDISAPGSAVMSTISSDYYDAEGQPAYGEMSGTSMAAPMVASAAALLLYINPSLTPDQIETILCSTATDLGTAGKDQLTGYGLLNMEAAAQRAAGVDLADAEVSEIAPQNATGKAVTPVPTVSAGGITLVKDTDYTLSYSNNVKPGTATLTITGKGFCKGTKTVNFTIKDATGIAYQVHAQTHGWMSWAGNDAQAGTTGQKKRLEGIRIKLTDPAYSGGVEYRTHIQSYGWETSWAKDGAQSGTTGEKKRLEAIQIRLTGEMAQHYDVYYRTHAQTYGWLGWAKNGETAGTSGYAKRLEAIQIRLVPKGGQAPAQSAPAVYRQKTVQYQTHVQTYGWQGAQYDGNTAGTTGQKKRLEGIRISLANPDYSGSIQYQTHVQTYGWESSWAKDGAQSGTTGQKKRLEAIRIRLTGEMEQRYDVYYRVHAQTYGWLDWAKNGDPAGTAGLAKRLEAIQIRLVPKGDPAPGSTARPYIEETDLIAGMKISAKTDQILVVNANGGSKATVKLWEKQGGAWKITREMSGFVGSKGVGVPSEYVARTPQGAYTLGFAFGIGENPGTKLAYRQITQNSYWVGDSSSPDYNTWQEYPYRKSWKDEHLIDYREAYEYAITLDFDNGRGGGSAFFLHVSNGRPTAGCISVPRDHMLYLMRTIDEGAYIVNVNDISELKNY